MTAIVASNKHILPVEISTAIIENYDSTLNIVDANTQVRSLNSQKSKFSLGLWDNFRWKRQSSIQKWKSL